jgi:hypothetical protein
MSMLKPLQNIVLVGLAWAMCVTPGRAGERWTVYRDSVHGCRLQYSTMFKQEPWDLEEKFLRFAGPNDRTFFRVMGTRNDESLSPAQIRAKYVASDIPGELVYERTRSDFLVLSGYRGDSIFYTKVAVSDDKRTICVLEITYPRKDKRALDQVVTRMSRTFMVEPSTAGARE